VAARSIEAAVHNALMDVVESGQSKNLMTSTECSVGCRRPLFGMSWVLPAATSAS